MRFPLKVVLSAVLAKNIVAELAQSSATQKVANDVVDLKYQQQLDNYQVPQNFQYPVYQQGLEQEGFEQEGFQQQAEEQDPAFDQQNLEQQRAYQVNPGQESIENQSSNVAAIDQYTGQPSAYQNVAVPPGYIPNFPYAQGYPGYNPHGFNVQTGYEGFLLPEPAEVVKAPVVAPRVSPFSSFAVLQRSVPELMRQSGTYLTKAFTSLFSWISLAVFGGAATTAICTFTPLCSITFATALPFVRALGLEGPLMDSWKNLLEGAYKYSFSEKEFNDFFGKSAYQNATSTTESNQKLSDEKTTVDKSEKVTIDKNEKITIDKSEKSTTDKSVGATIEKIVNDTKPELKDATTAAPDAAGKY